MSQKEGKTEKASPRRREEARKEGQIARSTEVGVALSLAGTALGVRVFGPGALDALRHETAVLFTNLEADQINGALVAGSATRMALAVGAPFLVLGTLGALVAGVGQVGFKLTPKAGRPKLSHLSPKKGLERLKPSVAGWELGRTVVKLGLLAALLWGPVTEWSRSLGADRNIDAGLGRVMQQTWTVLLRGVLLMVVVAALDYGYQRWKMSKQLRMSKEELKREHKDQEGDPLVKGQRRRRAHELSRNRMLRDVVSADVVVTNPTHLAVALRYDAAEGAPRVVAKGADKIAAKIRAQAYRHGVLVTEDKPLARTLYRRCKVGQFVPSALYEAVAIVLALAYRRYGRQAA